MWSSRSRNSSFSWSGISVLWRGHYGIVTRVIHVVTFRETHTHTHTVWIPIYIYMHFISRFLLLKVYIQRMYKNLELCIYVMRHKWYRVWCLDAYRLCARIYILWLWSASKENCRLLLNPPTRAYFVFRHCTQSVFYLLP